jgi:hypothetical protein
MPFISHNQQQPNEETTHVDLGRGQVRLRRANLYNFVIAGLDPAIHPLRKTPMKRDGYAGQARE